MKPVFKKAPIDKYFLKVDPNYLLITSQTVCIDKDGNFYVMDLPSVRLLNESYWNHNSEHFGEKLTFINDYLTFSVSEGRDIHIDISSNVKPTEKQLTAVFTYIKNLRKNYKDLTYSAWWRWSGGGGCSIYSFTKLPGLLETKVREAIEKNKFDGYTNPHYEVQE